MNIQSLHIANLFSYARYKGIEEKHLRIYLNKMDLDICDLENSVSEQEFLNVLNALIDKTDDKHFGLHYGCFLNIKALGFIVQLSLNATSIQQAVHILQNYFEVSFPLVSLEAIETKGKYILEVSTKVNNLKIQKHILDIAYCFLYRELKLMITDEAILTLRLPKDKILEFEKSLYAEAVKGKDYAFIFSSKLLSLPINQKSLRRIEILLPQFLKMLDKKKAGYKPFSIQVRNMVLNMCTPELPNFEQVAAQFLLSDRTIQRKLTGEGLSFRKIIDDVKKELSNYLSKGNGMTTQDIAYALGYSESSAYLHAVKKWNPASL